MKLNKASLIILKKLFFLTLSILLVIFPFKEGSAQTHSDNENLGYWIKLKNQNNVAEGSLPLKPFTSIQHQSLINTNFNSYSVCQAKALENFQYKKSDDFITYSKKFDKSLIFIDKSQQVTLTKAFPGPILMEPKDLITDRVIPKYNHKLSSSKPEKIVNRRASINAIKGKILSNKTLDNSLLKKTEKDEPSTNQDINLINDKFLDFSKSNIVNLYTSKTQEDIIKEIYSTILGLDDTFIDQELLITNNYYENLRIESNSGYSVLSQLDNKFNWQLDWDDSKKLVSKVKFHDDSLESSDIIVVNVIIRNLLSLDDLFIAYKENGNVFLSLIDFSRAIGFPIEATNDPKVVSGWFMDKRRKFLLDLNKSELTIKKNKYEIDSSRIKLIDNNIYVDTRLIEEWFPMRVIFNQKDQEVHVRPLEILPIEEEFVRGRKWEEMTPEKEDLLDVKKQQEYKIETVKVPYKPLSVPLTDIRYSFSRNRSENLSLNKSKIDILMNGDFLYLSNRLFINVEGTDISNIRLTSGRKDNDGKLLGPLKAREFSIGDVYSPQVTLISKNQSGKGFLLSNVPEEKVLEFDKITINGNMNPGWDVELYRNDVLLSFRKVSMDGRYEFLDVPLNVGLNIIRLVFYGPFGQKREEIKKYLVGQDLIKKNQLYYNISINKQNESLIKLGNTKDESSIKDIKDGSDRYIGQFIYGLTKNTSLALDFVSVPLGDKEITRHNYHSTSIRSSLFGLYGRYDFIRDVTSGFNATQASLQAELFDYNIVFKQEKYDKNFISEQNQLLTNKLIRKDSLRLDGSIDLPLISQNPRFSLSGSKDYFSSKKELLNVENDISFILARVINFTENIKYTYDDQTEEPDQRSVATGKTLMNYKILRSVMLRAIFSYNIKPVLNMVSSTAIADYEYSKNLTFSASHSYHFPYNNQGRSNIYTLNINRTIKDYIASLGVNFNSTSSDYGINLNLSFSIGYDQKYKTKIVSGSPLADSSIVMSRVFLDSNTNNKYDDNELLFSDVSFSNDSGSGKTKTNEKGLAISYIAPDRPVKIGIEDNNNGIDDPYLWSKNRAFRVISHRGSIASIDFPIYQTGDIQGITKIKKDDKISNVSEVILELVDLEGKVLKTTSSSFDGFYLFEMVPFGKYKLRISKEQFERLGLENDVIYDVELNQILQSLKGFDFIIEQKAKTEE